jgi:hypothetical protein
MSQAGQLGIDGIPTVPTQFVTDSGTAVPAANILNVLGGAGIATSGSGDTIVITAIGQGFTWNVVTSAMNPITLTPENGYIAKGASPVQFNLPVGAGIGDTYKIVGYGNLWSIAQNANQAITLGIATTTLGVFGSMAATTITDNVEIVCVTNNFEFFCVDSIGNPALN